MNETVDFAESLRAAADAYDEPTKPSGSYDAAIALLKQLAGLLEWGATKSFTVSNGIEIYAEETGSGDRIDNYNLSAVVRGKENRVISIRPGWTQFQSPSEYAVREWLHRLEDPQYFVAFVARVAKHNEESRAASDKTARLISAMSKALMKLDLPAPMPEWKQDT